MKRTSRNFDPAVLRRWRQVTDMLGWGQRGMVKLLMALLDHAEQNPDSFRKR
jgi:hypothetical protein